MAENLNLEQELIAAVDNPEAETWAPPPTPFANFANITLVVPKKTSARRMAWITQRVEFMMGAYRRDDFNNPAIWAMNVTQLLEQFPDIVIESVTSAKSGLQTECAFPPSPAEIRARAERSLRQYKNIAVGNARKALAAEKAKNPVFPPSIEPRTDLLGTHPYFSPEARQAHNDANRAASGQPEKWRPRSPQGVAAAWGITVTDEQIAALPNNPERSDFHKLRSPLR